MFLINDLMVLKGLIGDLFSMFDQISPSYDTSISGKSWFQGFAPKCYFLLKLRFNLTNFSGCPSSLLHI